MVTHLQGMRRREQLRHALGIAEYHGPRSQMMREIANPSMLHDGLKLTERDSRFADFTKLQYPPAEH